MAGWLWFTVIFANFAEALAEGRSKAQAAALRGAREYFETIDGMGGMVAAIERIERGLEGNTYSDPLMLVPIAKLALKLAKAGWRSNNIDPNARHCMASAVAGIQSNSVTSWTRASGARPINW